MDWFLVLGELDSMSGLWNCCFVLLEVGVVVVIFDVWNKGNFFGICEVIGNFEIIFLGIILVFLN